MNHEDHNSMEEIRDLMAVDARPGFSEADIEHLHVLIRLVTQFRDYLRSAAPDLAISSSNFEETMYVIDAILFNVESFRKIMQSYSVLVGSEASTLSAKAITVASVGDQFLKLYDVFLHEAGFEPRCRLLLDMFKLEIVFAGAYYDLKSPHS
jgi:hypothetical protein